MSPDARIAALEVKVVRLESSVDVLATKIDELLVIASMGKGIGWFIIKIGGVATGIVGIVYMINHMISSWR